MASNDKVSKQIKLSKVETEKKILLSTSDLNPIGATNEAKIKVAKVAFPSSNMSSTDKVTKRRSSTLGIETKSFPSTIDRSPVSTHDARIKEQFVSELYYSLSCKKHSDVLFRFR